MSIDDQMDGYLIVRQAHNLRKWLIDFLSLKVKYETICEKLY